MGGDLCVYALKEAVWQGKPEVDPKIRTGG